MSLLLFLPLKIHTGHNPYFHTDENEAIERLSDLSELIHTGNWGLNTNFLSHSFIFCSYQALTYIPIITGKTRKIHAKVEHSGREEERCLSSGST